MARAMKKAVEEEYWRWNRYGDGPDVELDGHPENPGKEVVEWLSKRAANGSGWDTTCRTCKLAGEDHGQIYQEGIPTVVCPGDFIVRKEAGGFRILNPAEFMEGYDLVPEDGAECDVGDRERYRNLSVGGA